MPKEQVMKNTAEAGRNTLDDLINETKTHSKNIIVKGINGEEKDAFWCSGQVHIVVAFAEGPKGKERYSRIDPNIQSDSVLMAKIQGSCQEFLLVPAVNDFGRVFILRVKIKDSPACTTRLEAVKAAQSGWSRFIKDQRQPYLVRSTSASEIEQDARIPSFSRDEAYSLAFQAEITSPSDERIISACRKRGSSELSTTRRLKKKADKS